jgi:hypothetical protein
MTALKITGLKETEGGFLLLLCYRVAGRLTEEIKEKYPRPAIFFFNK